MMLMGHHLFGAILAGPDQETVLIEQGNVDSVNHSENPTMSVSSQSVFDQCLKRVDLVGPVAVVEEEVLQVQRGFWVRV
ncbi:hypothetical protein [Paraburkholderia pallida]|uniref:hypothetical protein n=1 Tax=Paraburkholderia pallida TaxID=2547399 RepID=UPI00300533CA